MAAGVLIGVVGTLALVAAAIGLRGRLSTLSTGRSRPLPEHRTTEDLVPSRESTAIANSRARADAGWHFEPAGSPRLPRFSDVGGNDAIKVELESTIGLVLSHPHEAQTYRVSWNGILFHGPPGSGKSFMARAMAGEFGLNFLRVSTSDLVTSTVGAGPERVRAVFDQGLQHLPCLLFFDEFDSVAPRRDDDPGTNARQVVTELLQSLEEYHSEPRMVVVAAINDLTAIDPAVTRPGRFDRVIGLDVPDAGSRKEIFAAALKGRPCASLDLARCAERSQGCSPAAIVRAVDSAALAALRESIGTGRTVRISTRHLVAAIDQKGFRDRPTVEDWNWSKLILPAAVLAELQELQALIEDPARSESLGIDPPTGVLLTGPPGTGKTTIGKVLAAESSCSFYPVTGADITSRWVGESERAVARLFTKARENTPAILFVDEVDAIAGQRGQLGAYDRQLDQLLLELDGLRSNRGLFVIGATNRPQAVDPALLRAGRLSRVIQIPLPDLTARRGILELLTADMPIDGVSIDALAEITEGFSGADLKGLCQQAAVHALIRSDHDSGHEITESDFDGALADENSTLAARESTPALRRRSRAAREEPRH